MDIYRTLQKRFREIVDEQDLSTEEVSIAITSLTPEESIGSPKRRDFPLLTGKEAMVEATFRGSKGQAFTLSRATFSGSLEEIVTLDLRDDYNKALFIASLNAVLKSLGRIERTVHCKNEEPEECAGHMAKYFLAHYPRARVVLIGYQPAILENLAKAGVRLRVLDLNPENIHTCRYGVEVEDGVAAYRDATKWAEVLLVTGSTLANGTIEDFLCLEKEVLFYGNTIAGAAYLLGLSRLCFKAS